MVREGEHDGDSAELRDAGDVPTLREHRLLLAALPDPTGEEAFVSLSFSLSLLLQVCSLSSSFKYSDNISLII